MSSYRDYKVAVGQLVHLQYEGATIMNHHQSGWWVLRGESRSGRRVVLGESYRTTRGNWEVPRYGVELADGRKLASGERYPIDGSAWYPAPGDSELRPFSSFEEASQFAVQKYGVTGEWRRGDYSWVQADGKGLKLGAIGRPCEDLVRTGERISSGSLCNRYVDRDGLCKMHANAQEKIARNTQAEKEKWEAKLASMDRARHTRSLVESTLEELAEVLGELGYNINTFGVGSDGDAIGVRVPAETFRDLVARAVELEGMKEL